MSRFATLVLATAASLGPAAMPLAAQDQFRDARIRYSEGGVTLQRESEPAAEEAVANVLVLPGDRIWTDRQGRVELQFADGSLVRLDSRSKLDFMSNDDGRDDRVVLRLWSGALMLHAVRRNAASFAIETPAGLVEASDRALLRVDFEDGEARVSVLEGEASLEGSHGRPVDLVAGERSYLRRGEAPETARSFDSRRTDDFDDWNGERDSREALAEGNRRSLPAEISPYAGELEANGSWYYMAEVGNVWRPSVDAGWQPYVNGRWDWSSYGWGWVAGEPWGWATSHYGRWGYAGGIGWYWIPGSVWAPAWVSWAVGNDYVGWCPLGYGDVPVSVGHGHREARGYAVPRGTAGGPGSHWVYTRKSDLRTPDVARRRVSLGSADVQALRVAPAHGRPTRDLQRIAEGPVAVPRTVNIKPTMGDFVPELAGDSTTTIPVRAPRQPARQRDDVGWSRRAIPANEETEDRRSAAPSSAPDGRKPVDRSSGVSAVPRTQERREPENRRLSEPDREVLRRIFRPVPDAHERERTGSDAGRAGSDAGRKAAPRREPSSPAVHAAPPPQAPRTAPPPAARTAPPPAARTAPPPAARTAPPPAAVHKAHSQPPPKKEN